MGATGNCHLKVTILFLQSIYIYINNETCTTIIHHFYTKITVVCVYVCVCVRVSCHLLGLLTVL